MPFFKRRTKKASKTLKKFKKAKFNYSKYIRDFYMEKGQAYISVKVDSIEDIISKYSIKGYEFINTDFAEYVESHAYNIPVEYQTVIEICGCTFNDEQKVLIEEVIYNYFGLKLYDAEFNLEINRNKSIILFTCSAVILGIIWAISRFEMNDPLTELIALLFWFCAWEYADLGWLHRAELRELKLEAGQLATVKIIFDEENKNT